MIVEIIPKIGQTPIRLDASQVLVRNDRGTPIAVAGEYGPDGCVRAAHAGDAGDFNRTLRAFGYDRHQVTLERLTQAPPPAGARLLTSL